MSLGSHVHQTPQVGFAQMDPATSASPVNSTPISAEDTAIASKMGRLDQSHPIDARKTTTKAREASHADGTGTDMIRQPSPWTGSARAHARRSRGGRQRG